MAGRIKEIRLMTGLSQKQFASFYEIPSRTIENWEFRKSEQEYIDLILERLVKYDLDNHKFDCYSKNA